MARSRYSNGRKPEFVTVDWLEPRAGCRTGVDGKDLRFGRFGQITQRCQALGRGRRRTSFAMQIGMVYAIYPKLFSGAIKLPLSLVREGRDQLGVLILGRCVGVGPAYRAGDSGASV